MRPQEYARTALTTWRLALLPAMLIAAALPAQADWRQLAPQNLAVLSPHSYLPGANGSLWSLSDDGVRLTLADGTTRVVLRHEEAPYFEGELLADGGIVLRSQCRVQRLDAQGRRSWSLPGSALDDCNDLAVQADGRFWLSRDERLLAYDAHGKQQASVEAGDSGLQFKNLVTLTNGDVVAARNASDVAAAKPAMLTRYNRRGRPAWSWTSAEPASLNQLTLSSDGDILAQQRHASPANPTLQRWNSSGQLLWTLPLPDQTSQVLGILPAANGEAVVFTGFIDGSARLSQVLRVTRDGRIRWQQAGACTEFSASQFVPDGADGFALTCVHPFGVQLRRWNADGETGTAIELLLGPYPASLYRLDADTLLALGEARGSDSASRNTLYIHRDGRVIDGPIDYVQPASTELGGQYLAADGSSYLATQRTDSRAYGYDLTRYAADGSRLWTLAQPNPQYRFDNVPISAAAGKVCIAEHGILAPPTPPTQIVCVNSDDGSPAWSMRLAPTATICALRVLDDGRVVSVTSPQSDRGRPIGPFSVQTHDANGQIIAQAETYGCFAAIDANGRATVVSATYIAQYEADGQRNYRVERESGIRQSNQALASGDDGSAWLVERPEGQPSRVRALRPDGSTRWLVPGGGSDRSEDTAIAAAGDAVYLLQRSDSTIGIQSRLQRLDAASGTQRWEYDSVNPGRLVSSAAQFAVSADGSRVVLAHAWPDRLRLERLDAQSGLIEHERFVAANNSTAPMRQLFRGANNTTALIRRGVHGLALDARGTARLTMNLLDDSAGLTAGLLSIDHVGSAAPLVRIDQPGVTGAWWSPYANGEGIVLDWFPAQRTLFGAWFTYTTAGGNDPAQLRWYTIQAGNIAANATSVQLPILETSGGNFDAGPPASPAPVGTATLSFTDCDNATLTYAFDAGHNDGVTGTITLSRLTPATQSCILADGTTRPAAGAKPPQGGFDARMSGTWFEEATSGQGLQFTVQPGGVFFAPWFTYDPQGQGNDTNREHWFTLQGSLAGAANGTAEVLIAQSLGGVFDRVPTYNGFAVGRATVTMTACDKARIDYRFDDTDLAGVFRKRSGTLELSKIGGCGP